MIFPEIDAQEQTVASEVRGRVLLAYFAISLVAAVIVVNMFWPSWASEATPPPLPGTACVLIWYALLLVLLKDPLARRGSQRALLRVDAGATGWGILGGVGLLAVSVTTLYAVYLPLSYVAPDFVRWWLIEDPAVLIWTSDHSYQVANGLTLATGVLVAPLVEELFFRGLLLPAWIRRWSTKRAIVSSALAFAILHTDVVGAFIFGVVTAVAFLTTRSLWMPIVMHVTHNTLVWLFALGDLVVFGERTGTIRDFQASWWMALPGLVMGVPVLVKVWRHLHDLPVARQASETP